MNKNAQIQKLNAERLHRRAEAFASSAIEGQAPSQDDVEMFEMFDRAGLSFEERRDFIVAQAKRDGEAELAAE